MRGFIAGMTASIYWIAGMMPLAVVAVFVENRDAVLFGVLPVAQDLFFRVLDIG